MEDIIKKKCEEVGINPNILTPQEREMLKEEIEAERNGMSLVGGVLDNPELYSREMAMRLKDVIHLCEGTKK